MKRPPSPFLIALLFVLPLMAGAQVPVTPAPDQAALVASSEPRLAANKRLVYDFWREVFEAAHLEFADRYLAESYIQHNPNVPTGRQAFVDFFTRVKQPKPIEARIAAPVVAIVAEGDYVTMVFARTYRDPKDPSATYTSTWFDLFRIENGKIAEHWDAATKS